jgi:hypothetical protein
VWGVEADHFMSIISLDGELEFARYNRTSQIVHISHKTTKALIHLGPRSLGDKWRTPNHGFYVPTDVNLVITPHISENAGVTAVVKLIDDSDEPQPRLISVQGVQPGDGFDVGGLSVAVLPTSGGISYCVRGHGVTITVSGDADDVHNIVRVANDVVEHPVIQGEFCIRRCT